jgi:hypothetical protein
MEEESIRLSPSCIVKTINGVVEHTTLSELCELKFW